MRQLPVSPLGQKAYAMRVTFRAECGVPGRALRPVGCKCAVIMGSLAGRQVICLMTKRELP
jgi:hypothetical protein